MVSLQEEGLKQVIQFYKDENGGKGSIWFNGELVDFKEFMEYYNESDIYKVLSLREQTWILLDECGDFNVVSVKSAEENEC